MNRRLVVSGNLNNGLDGVRRVQNFPNIDLKKIREKIDGRLFADEHERCEHPATIEMGDLGNGAEHLVVQGIEPVA